MRGRGTILATLALLSSFALFASSCSDEVCEEAEGKLRDCLAQLDCNRVDPQDRPRCVSAKSSGEAALSKMSGAPCVSEVSDLAEQINRCNPDPGDFCDCF